MVLPFASSGSTTKTGISLPTTSFSLVALSRDSTSRLEMMPSDYEPMSTMISLFWMSTMYPLRISPTFGRLKSADNKKSIGCSPTPLPDPVVLISKMLCLSISPILRYFSLIILGLMRLAISALEGSFSHRVFHVVTCFDYDLLLVFSGVQADLSVLNFLRIKDRDWKRPFLPVLSQTASAITCR